MTTAQLLRHVPDESGKPDFFFPTYRCKAPRVPCQPVLTRLDTRILIFYSVPAWCNCEMLRLQLALNFRRLELTKYRTLSPRYRK